KDGKFQLKFKQVANPDFTKYPNASYVGSEACAACHNKDPKNNHGKRDAYAIWLESKHAHAYKTLETAKNPSLRQFDGECLKCHTIGFGYKTGFVDEATDVANGISLKNVGCESCHGPCSDHVAKPGNKEIHLVINKFKWRGPGQQPPAANAARLLQI